MAKKIGEMRFCFDDWREDCDESIDCTFAVAPFEGDEFSIEEYWRLCRYVAAAMGFGDNTIKEWFGGL